jgi:hypothetical protein
MRREALDRLARFDRLRLCRAESRADPDRALEQASGHDGGTAVAATLRLGRNACIRGGFVPGHCTERLDTAG